MCAINRIDNPTYTFNLQARGVATDIIERACPVPILALVFGMLCAPSGNLLTGRLPFHVR